MSTQIKNVWTNIEDLAIQFRDEAKEARKDAAICIARAQELEDAAARLETSIEIDKAQAGFFYESDT